MNTFFSSDSLRRFGRCVYNAGYNIQKKIYDAVKTGQKKAGGITTNRKLARITPVATHNSTQRKHKNSL